MIEYYFMCPYCGENISMLVDPSIYSQQYIEDCEVCCNPIQITYYTAEGEIEQLNAESIEQ